MLRILLLAPSLLACAKPAAPRPIQNRAGVYGTLPCDRPLEKDTGGVHGILIGKHSKQPVVGAKFVAVPHGHWPQPWPNTTTDSAGCFFIGSLPPIPQTEVSYGTDTSGGSTRVDIIADRVTTLDLVLDDTPSLD